MITTIDNDNVKKLWGQSFILKQLVDNTQVNFVIPEQTPRKGSEGYGLLVDCHHPVKTGFLKVFKVPVPERRDRTKFLTKLGLSKLHWLFQGLPFGSLSNVVVNDLPISGYVTRCIVGSDGKQAMDLLQLMGTERWTYDLAQRRRFCGELCCAVAALEALGLVHGDLSLGNIMIGTNREGREAAVLCDFDAFFYPSQPLLPLTVGKIRCRTSGSPGFQYRGLLEDIENKNKDVCVRSDRFALGALICQIMTWKNDTGDLLGRPELLTDGCIRARDMMHVDVTQDDVTQRTVTQTLSDLRDSWPEGFRLLDQALQATSTDDFPAPREWLALVGGPPLSEPFIILEKRHGKTVLTTHCISLDSTGGTLERVHADLGQVGFTLEDGKVHLDLRWTAPVLRRRRDGPLEQLGNSPCRVEATVGDVVSSNSWYFKVRNRH